jgi:protein-S-isoprenylcysteine O-methyltransferase Ste14
VTPSFFARGGGWVLAQSALMLAVLAAGPLARDSAPGRAAEWLGISLIMIGAGFGIAGVAVLGRNRTLFPKPKPDSVLVAHGIYRWVRHPLYTSVMALSFGWALVWGSYWAGLLAAALAGLLWAKARREERWLRAQFPGYAAYAQEVPRFLPRGRRT